MTGSNVIDLRDRLFRPFRMRAPAPSEGIEVVEYQQAAIREDVPVTVLSAALATHGLAFTIDPALGVVIHPATTYDEAG